MSAYDGDQSVTACSHLTILIDGVEFRPELRPAPDAPIFIVHGHAHLQRERVRRFLEQATGRRAVVLDEQPNEGQDILGKLVHHISRSAFAVVLLTGDDEGRARGEDSWRPRARQNVLLELGGCILSLGRRRVVALYEPGVEIPSDYLGVGYVELDAHGGWKLRLAAELRAAGIEADLNRVK